MPAGVSGVHSGAEYTSSKLPAEEIELIAGLGVQGDAHQGAAQVQHRSRVAADPAQPNLRQVHLIHDELFDYVSDGGFRVRPGDLGENITTHGVERLDLPLGSILRVGSHALLAVTGLRNPCRQIDDFQEGLLQMLRYQDDEGALIKLAGIMAVVVAGGVIRPGDSIEISLPPGTAKKTRGRVIMQSIRQNPSDREHGPRNDRAPWCALRRTRTAARERSDGPRDAPKAR